MRCVLTSSSIAVRSIDNQTRVTVEKRGGFLQFKKNVGVLFLLQRSKLTSNVRARIRLDKIQIK